MSVNAKQFSDAIGSVFQTEVDGSPLSLSLSSVNVKASNENEERFSLLFTMEKKNQSEHPVSQQILSLQSEQLGKQDIFVVPVAEDKDKFVYEAVFNLQKNPQ